MRSLEYLAAVLDVNGYMTIRDDRDYVFPILRLGGKKELLEMFSERFGGHVGSVPSRPNFFWCRQGVSAQEVLRQLRPFMALRLEQVDLILEWQPENRLKANGSISREAKRRGVPPVFVSRIDPKSIGGALLGDTEILNREPIVIHTIDHGTLTPAQRREREAKSAVNRDDYERRKGQERGAA